MANRLPYPYQEVEYLESNGTQYIKLENIIANKNIRVDITLKQAKQDFTYVYPVLVRNNSAGAYFCLKKVSGKAVVSLQDTASTQYDLPNTDIFTKETLTYTFQISGSIKRSTISDGISTKSRDMEITPDFLRLFGDGVLGSDGLQIESVVINYDSSDIGLVPCYDKTDTTKHTAGLYDLVNNQFYGNDGTGYFIVGEDVYNGGRITNMQTLKSVTGWKNTSGSPLVKMTNLNTGKYIEFGQEPVEAENEI